MKKKLSHTISIIISVFLAVSVITAVYVTIRSITDKPVMIGKVCIMQVITGSMEPVLHVGECIVIEKVSPDSLKERDIVAYVSEAQDIAGKTVTHRISSINEDGSMILRGDANPTDDPIPVKPQQIVGRYVRKSRFFTWLMSFGSLRKVLLLTVMLCTSLMAVYEVRTIMQVGKESAQERHERIMREAIDAEIKRLAAENYQPSQKEENQD